MTKRKRLHEMRANHRATGRVLGLLGQMWDRSADVKGPEAEAFGEKVRTAGAMVTYLRDRLADEIRKEEKA